MVEPNQVIDLLSDHEKAIGNLYLEFSRCFPEQRDFWLRCSNDEFEHAEIIQSMKYFLESGEVIFSGRFNEAAIQTSLKYIYNQMDKAKQKKISVIEAHSIAFSLECSILENRFFDVFRGDTVKFEKIKRGLIEETKKHKNAIQAAWEKYQSLEK